MASVNVFLKQPAEWLKAVGPDHDIVVSSRIRIARNLSGFNFSQKLTEDQQAEILKTVERIGHSSKMMKSALFFDYADLTPIDKQFLVERHLISREHASEKGRKAAMISPSENLSVMIMEEDHLRIQAFQSGFNLLESWRQVNQIDDEFEKSLEYAFDANLGYLTACPTNVGTGLRASCMLHLPSLVLTKQVHKVLQALAKLNLAARGLYGEGTQATGNFFQFSNQMTLGQQEEEIIENLSSVIRQVIDHEREAREHLKQKRKLKFEDQLWRSLGTLKSARIISSLEATQHLSLVQLGLQMGLIAGSLTNQELNQLLLLIQPAHLQKTSGKALSSADRDQRRAEIIRSHFKNVLL